MMEKRYTRAEIIAGSPITECEHHCYGSDKVRCCRCRGLELPKQDQYAVMNMMVCGTDVCIICAFQLDDKG